MRKKNRLVYGVGIMDLDYVTNKYRNLGIIGGKRRQIRVWQCPYYSAWVNMLARCYSPKTHEKCPTYLGCSVYEGWLVFSNFKMWMGTQDWINKQLDKDILFQGNKVYSPETCVFINQNVNKFILDSAATRGDYLIGVSWDKERCKYLSQCTDGQGRKKFLGRFDTELEAHKAWLAFKLEQAKLLAAEQTDPRVAKALIDRYENYVAQEKEVDKS